MYMYVLEESDNILYYFFLMETIPAFGQELATDPNKILALKYEKQIVKINIYAHTL